MSWSIHVSLLTAPTATIAIVGDFESFQFEVTLSAEGAGHVIVEQGALPESLLEKNTIWRFLEDGVPRGGFILEQIEDMDVDEDETAKTKISGRGLGAVLEWAKVYPGNFPASPVVERKWSGRSYPDVLHLFLTEARNRTTLSFVDISSWTTAPGVSTKDSNAVSWGSLVDSSINAGDDLLALTKRWANLHPFDWEMTADFKMHAYMSKGTDKSGTVILHKGGSLKEQKKTRVRRTLRNVYVVEDTQQKAYEYKDNDSITQWGRREEYIKPQEAIAIGPASMIAFAALATNKKERIERLAVLDPGPGRRPFHDFNLGDFVGVDDENVLTKYRCLAIVVGVDSEGQEDVEAVLDTLLGPEEDLSNTNSGGGDSSSTLLYTENTTALNITSVSQTVMPLSVAALAPTNGRAGIHLPVTISGVVAPNLVTVKIEILFDNIVAKTIEEALPLGNHVIGMPFILLGIPVSEKLWRLRLSTDVGAAAVVVNAASWWMESPDFAGGVSASDPNSIIIEPVVTDPLLVAPTSTAAPIVDFHFPVWPVVNEATIDDPATVAPTSDEAVHGGTGLVMPGIVPADVDDGWISTAPSFTSIGPQLQAGNQAGEVRSLFIRFDMLEDIVAQNIGWAEMRIMPDTNAIVAPRLKIRGVLSTAPASPTSKAEFDALVRTTAQVIWEVPATAGTLMITPDLSAIIDEIRTAAGGTPVTTVLLLIDDDSSTPGAYHAWRSFAHLTGPKPELHIRYSSS